MDFTFSPEGREKPILVKEPAILKKVGSMTTLEKNGTNLMLTIKGVVYPDEKVIIYDLGEAEESVIKPRGRKRKAWSFVNHISLLYFYGIVKALREKGLNDDYTPEDILAIGKNIYRVRDRYHGNDNRVSEITKADKQLLNDLGIKIE